MQSLRDILERLTPDERGKLHEIHFERNTVVSRMIIESLDNPLLTQEEFIEGDGITPGTFNKSQSLAIDAVYEVISSALRNPYDPIMLIRGLLFRGLVKEARRQYNTLEKEYSRQGIYSVLDTLYHEGVRICYQTGDLKWLAVLVEKITINATRLAEYTKLDGLLILQMMKLEKKAADISPSAVKDMNDLYERAVALRHPVLVQNALYSLYSYYTQHDFNMEQAHVVARLMLENAEQYRDTIDIYTRTLINNNYAHFLSTYVVAEDPEPYYRIVEKNIGMGGGLELFDFNFQRFNYYLVTGDHARSEAVHAKLRESQQENRFALLTHVAAAWLALDENDHAWFTAEIGRFYETPEYSDFPEHEFALRVMEIIFALRRRDYDYAAGKVDALRKFHVRKFRPAQDYRLLLNAAQRVVYAGLQGKNIATGSRGGRDEATNIALRSVGFLYSRLMAAGSRERG
ncbi:MAG: hypothetical protein JWQ98_589 [Chlorobi bacterium]|nr:hypothetical protein [Chlorobiota bacterium]